MVDSNVFIASSLFSYGVLAFISIFHYLSCGENDKSRGLKRRGRVLIMCSKLFGGKET